MRAQSIVAKPTRAVSVVASGPAEACVDTHKSTHMMLHTQQDVRTTWYSPKLCAAYAGSSAPFEKRSVSGCTRRAFGLGIDRDALLVGRAMKFSGLHTRV